MKIAIIALSASALIATAPAALAKDASTRTPGLHHKVSKRHSAGVSAHDPWHQMQTPRGYPGAYGYMPQQPSDYTYENSRNAGGGGGGGM